MPKIVKGGWGGVKPQAVVGVSLLIANLSTSIKEAAVMAPRRFLAKPWYATFLKKKLLPHKMALFLVILIPVFKNIWMIWAPDPPRESHAKLPHYGA